VVRRKAGGPASMSLVHPLCRLDFFDGLLEGLLEEDELKASYALDGTHLDPRYLQELLAPKLAAILREQA